MHVSATSGAWSGAWGWHPRPGAAASASASASGTTQGTGAGAALLGGFGPSATPTGTPGTYLVNPGPSSPIVIIGQPTMPISQGNGLPPIYVAVPTPGEVWAMQAAGYQGGQTGEIPYGDDMIDWRSPYGGGTGGTGGSGSTGGTGGTASGTLGPEMQAIQDLYTKLGGVSSRLDQLGQVLTQFLGALTGGGTGGTGSGTGGTGSGTGGTGGSTSGAGGAGGTSSGSGGAGGAGGTGGTGSGGFGSGGAGGTGVGGTGSGAGGTGTGGTASTGPATGGTSSATGGTSSATGGQGGSATINLNGTPLQLPATHGDININIQINVGSGSGTSVSVGGGGTSSSTTSSTTGGTGGAGGTGGTGGTGTGGTGGTGGAGGTGGTTSSGPIFSGGNFTGVVDLGKLTINGVETFFGILNAQIKGGVKSAEVARFISDAINANQNNVVTAQIRDDKVLLTSKIAGSNITIDNVSSDTDGLPTNDAFTGFFVGMTGDGTLLGNGVLPHQ